MTEDERVLVAAAIINVVDAVAKLRHGYDPDHHIDEARNLCVRLVREGDDDQD